MKAGEKQSNRLVDVATAGVLALVLGACGGDRAATETQLGDGANSQTGGTANADGGVAVEKPADVQDDALGSRVTSTLKGQPGLKAVSVDVDAASGAVTLYGTANTPAQRELAGQLALRVEGVKSVTNHLIVVKET
jgi:hypothetical protein